MVTRRTVLAVAAAALLAGCSSVDSAVAGLQKRYAAEAGVSSVTLSTSTQNEAIFAKNARGDVTLAEDTTTEQQAALVARFFEYAQGAGLKTNDLAEINFHMPHGSSLTIRFLMLDSAQSTEVVTALAAVPGASATVEIGAPLPGIWIDSTVNREVAKNIVASAALVAAVPYGPLFSTEVSVGDQAVHTYTVMADHRIGVGELRFAAEVQAWLATHPTDGFILPFSSADNASIDVTTVADESEGVRALARSARAAGIRNEVDAYLVQGRVPYLSIPRQ
jgi:hypothetical protein